MKIQIKGSKMNIRAIIFGSIGTLVETSDLQRQSFNQAFKEANLNWNWDNKLYQKLLSQSGGRNRIKNYATDQGISVDAKYLHQRKTEIYNKCLKEQNVQPRPGVETLIQYARSKKMLLGFATTTSEANIKAIFFALGNRIRRNHFDFIGSDTVVKKTKPSPDIYKKTLSSLKVNSHECLAIEDTEISMQSALAAGIRCVAFPGANALGDDFSGAEAITEVLTPANINI